MATRSARSAGPMRPIRPARRGPTKAQQRQAAAPSQELDRMGRDEMVALRRLSGQAKRLMAQAATTPLQRLAAQALRDEAAALAATLKGHRDQLGAQMGQTKLRSRAVSAYARAYRKA